MNEDERFQNALAEIDAANARDPNREKTPEGAAPKELVYGRRMSAWLERLYPAAGIPLRLAARAQHIRRWEVPRSDYPEGRTGYLKWRTGLYGYHAEKAAEILAGVGYDTETVERVKFLIQKKNLRRDPETQALEDVVCLVFLEFYFDSFSNEHPEEKVVDILQKTWYKMSTVGREAALRLAMPERARRLVEKALA